MKVTERETPRIPVRLSNSEDLVPASGAPCQDWSLKIFPFRLRIASCKSKGEERGPRQHELDLKLAEWGIGPYFREVSLDQPVNGAMTNATYGNGVLVLSIPKAKSGTGSNTQFQLKAIEPTRGERIGYTGSEIGPTGNDEKERAS